MSSHPKDATPRLFDVMAASSHVAKQLHLPFQSGNDRVLKEMNRRYTRQQYLDLVNYAKRVMPGLVLTSDVIISFPGGDGGGGHGHRVPGMEEVGFDALFTFISPPPLSKGRSHTDQPPRAEKPEVVWLWRLLESQNNMSAKLHARLYDHCGAFAGGRETTTRYPLTSRTEGSRLVRLGTRPDRAVCGCGRHRQQHLGAVARPFNDRPPARGGRPCGM